MGSESERGHEVSDVSVFPDVSVEDWKRRVSEEIDGQPVESLGRRLADGVRLEPLYTVEDRPEDGLPRIMRKTSGPAALCTVVEGRRPETVAEEIGEDLRGGADGIWLRLDRLARLGGDPGELVADERGLDGAPLLHGSDLATAFEGFPHADGPRDGLYDVATPALWIDVGANALPWAALWLADCERSDRDPAAVQTHFGADPLGSLARDGALPRDLMKLGSEAAALARFTTRRLPGSTALTLSTVVYEEAGADMAQQLGFMVATLLDTLRGLADSGLAAAGAAPAIALRVAVGATIFSEIAKLRAARLLWRAALGAVGVTGPPAAVLHVVGSRRTFTRREPTLNLLRASEQAFVAICGGADALSLHGFDTLGSGPTGSGARARRLARNTGLILEREGAIGRVEEPAAGSFYVEALTRELAEAGWAVAQEVERAGGMRRLLRSGRIAEMLVASAERRQRALEAGEVAVTGVTRYVDEARSMEEEAPQDAKDALDDLGRRLEEHRATWRELESGGGYSRDFVVEELVAAAGRGEPLWELGQRLGGSDGSETAEPLPVRCDAAPFETTSGEIAGAGATAGEGA